LLAACREKQPLMHIMPARRVNGVLRYASETAQWRRPLRPPGKRCVCISRIILSPVVRIYRFKDMVYIRQENKGCIRIG
jgi:hypothetical protein